MLTCSYLNRTNSEERKMPKPKSTTKSKRGRPKGAKAGGGKLARSETVTVRLDPRLRFAADLVARKHRRTLSSFIEWAVEETLKSVELAPGNPEHLKKGIDAANQVWDVDDADRFAKMAMNYPNLLNHNEEKVFKIAKEHGYFWRGKKGKDGEWVWKTLYENFIFERFREAWETVQKVASGELTKDQLPS